MDKSCTGNGYMYKLINCSPPILNLKRNLSSLITLVMSVFSMLKITRGLQIFQKLAPSHTIITLCSAFGLHKKRPFSYTIASNVVSFTIS